MRKIHGAISEIKTKPNAPRSFATEILTHRKLVNFQYTSIPERLGMITDSSGLRARFEATQCLKAGSEGLMGRYYPRTEGVIRVHTDTHQVVTRKKKILLNFNSNKTAADSSNDRP